MGTMSMSMSMRQPENWLYEIWQKGHDSPCYVMVPNAKDLVKSHLMIAVREEVEVLKEKISELLDKINQLEVENTILKANMSQETLQQLQMQTQLQITGTGTLNTTANMLTSSGQTAVPPAAVQATASPAPQSASVPASAAVPAVLTAPIATVGVGASPVVTAAAAAAAAGATPSPQPGSQTVATAVSNNSPLPPSMATANNANTIYDGTNGDNLNNQTTNNCSSTATAAAAEGDDDSNTGTTADTNAGLIS